MPTPLSLRRLGRGAPGRPAFQLALGVVAVLWGLSACSSGEGGSADASETTDAKTGTGGSTATGGTTGNGNAPATGGVTGSGGLTGAGGLTASGGSGVTGGSTGAGGISATGGSTGAGGSTGTGGRGGAATGGAAGGGGRGGSGGSGGSGALGGCAVSPVDPLATSQAKNLLCYLYSIYGNHVLSGQQETSWSNPQGDINFYVTNVGKYPAILGGDYLYPGGTTSRAQAYWAAGGLTMMRYHMGAPPLADTYANSEMSTNYANVLTSGTSENTSLLSKLDYLAGELKTLQSANVAVIMALFHEVQPNGWFWWAKGTGPQFIALWQLSFNYLTKTKGIHNVVWLLPYSGSPSSAYFPGKTYVDICGPDEYDNPSNQPFSGYYRSVVNIVGSSFPIPLHETGAIP